MTANGQIDPIVIDPIVHATPQEQLQARLADPHTVDSLNRLLDHLDTISSSVEMLEGFLRRGDEIADNVADSVNDLRGLETGEAADFVEKLPQMARAGSKMADVANSPSFDQLIKSGLLERMAEPSTIAGLTALLDKLDLLVFAANSVDEFLRRGDVIADSAADSVGDLRKLAASVSGNISKLDLKYLTAFSESLPQIMQAGQQVLASGMLGKVSELADAGMTLSKAGFFEPQTVQTLAEMGRSAAESYQAAKTAPQKNYGIFDLMRLLKEPAIQKTLNIAVETARQFGRKTNA